MNNEDEDADGAAKEPLGFMSLPVEIRLIIYRLALRGENPVRPPRRPVQQHYLSSHWQHGIRGLQLLLVCRIIYDEALPVLFAENRWQIDLTTDTAHNPAVLYPAPITRELDRHRRASPDPPDAPDAGELPSMLPYIRRIKIKIEWHPRYPGRMVHHTNTDRCCIRADAIRVGIRQVGQDLLSFPNTQFLCIDGNVSDSSFDQEGQNIITCMLQTWFGHLRGIKRAALDDVLPSCVKFLRERLQAPKGTLDPLSPVERYKRLELLLEAHDAEKCSYRLNKALRAVEAEGVERFRRVGKSMLQRFAMQPGAIEGRLGLLRLESSMA